MHDSIINLLYTEMLLCRIWFNDETQYMNDESDSEAADFDDEDSNGKTYDTNEMFLHELIYDNVIIIAEDFYQNDYPDEESDEDFEERKWLWDDDEEKGN